MAADAANAAPIPMAISRLRSSTQMKKMSSLRFSARARNATRRDPIAPMAAPTRPMIDRTVVRVRLTRDRR